MYACTPFPMKYICKLACKDDAVLLQVRNSTSQVFLGVSTEWVTKSRVSFGSGSVAIQQHDLGFVSLVSDGSGRSEWV